MGIDATDCSLNLNPIMIDSNAFLFTCTVVGAVLDSELFINRLNIKRQRDCLWKQRTHYRIENGSFGFIKLFISRNEVCNTDNAL